LFEPPPPATRLSLLSPEVVAAIDPERLRALLEASYAPELARLVQRDRMATARALWGRKAHPHAADRLEWLERFAMRAGRDALVEAARDVRVDHAGWEREAPADLAARLLADSISQHHVLSRAHLRLLRMPARRPTYELRATAARRVPEGKTGALVAALREVAGGDGGSGDAGTDAWLHEDEETGDLRAVVLHGVPGTPASPPRADAFRFRVAEGRLAMTLARPQLLDAYAAAWSTALYDAPRFFLDAPSVTLKPLQELGSAGLQAATERGQLLPEVPRVRVVACRLEAGDGHRIETTGPDALARIAPLLRGGGHISRATVRVDVAGEERGVDCVVHPPHRIDVGWGGVARSGARGPRIAREALARLGLLSPGTIADDITTMLPLLHPEWRWQEVAGLQGWALMRLAGLLEEVQGREIRRPSHPGFRHFGRSAVGFPLFRPVTPLRGGHVAVDPDAPEHEKRLVLALHEATDFLVERTQYYVVPDDPALQAVSVPQKDMVMHRLSLGALLRKARSEMGLERGKRPKLPRGVLWVGEMRAEGGVVRFFYVVRAATDEKDRAALGRQILRAAGFGRAVVLVPKGRKLGRDFVELELTVREQLGADGWRGKVGEAVRALGIEDEVAPERVVTADARCVVDTRNQRVLLDGVLVKLSEGGCRLVVALAQQHAKGVEIVPTRVTDKAMSGARESEGATRNVVWRMRSWIERSFAEAGKEVPEDVREAGLVKWVRGKGWRLVVKAVIT
jgi:hypothetical protein